MTADLRFYLTRFRQRLRLLDGFQLAQRMLWLPALAALIIQLVGRAMPVERLDWWSLSALPIYLAAWAFWSIFRPLPIMDVARRVDLELGLRERLSTALSLDFLSPADDPVNQHLVQKQRQDALTVASGIHPAQALPFTWLPRSLGFAVALFTAAWILAWLPNAMDITLAQRQAIRQEAIRQAEKIEQLSQQIEQAKELSPEERQELLRQLAELSEKLRQNRSDLEQSIADLSNLEKQLTQQLDPSAEAQQANLEALAAQLESMTGAIRQPDQSAGDAAAQALAELAEQLPNLTSKQRGELVQDLAQMASQAAQSGDAQLAQAIAALAQAVQQGNDSAAQSASQTAQEALSQAQARLAKQASLQQTIDQLQLGRQALAQAAQQAALAQGQTSGQNAGQNPAPGAGQSAPGQTGAGQAGAGQGQPSGNVTGGGSQSSTLPPATGGQGSIRPRGQAPDAAPEDLSSQVFAPWARPAESGGELSIPGLETGQGETQITQGQSNLPGAANPSLVPYQQVFLDYLSAANQALGQSYVPAGMSEFIRQYFSRLNP